MNVVTYECVSYKTILALNVKYVGKDWISYILLKFITQQKKIERKLQFFINRKSSI